MNYIVGIPLNFNGFQYSVDWNTNLREGFLSSIHGVYHVGARDGDWADDERLHAIAEHMCWRVLFEQQRFVLKRGFMLSFASGQLLKTDVLLMSETHPFVLTAIEADNGALLLTEENRELLQALKEDVVNIGLRWLDKADRIFTMSGTELAARDEQLVGLFADELKGWRAEE